MKKEKTKSERLSVRVPTTTKRELERLSIVRRISVSELVNSMIMDKIGASSYVDRRQIMARIIDIYAFLEVDDFSTKQAVLRQLEAIECLL